MSLLKLNSAAFLGHPLVPGLGTGVCANLLLPELMLYLLWSRDPEQRSYAKNCLNAGTSVNGIIFILFSCGIKSHLGAW